MLILALLIVALVSGEDDEPYIVYANGATSERNLPLCTGPREACNVIRQRFWLSDVISRMCKCPDRTSCPNKFTDASDKWTIFFNVRAQLKFCSRVSELEQCATNEIAAGIGMNGTINIYCFCGTHHFYQRLYRNSTGRYFKCVEYGSCQQNDFCGHISSLTYETYHTCTCPKKNICTLQNRDKVYADEFLYRGPAYKGICVPRS